MDKALVKQQSRRSVQAMRQALKSVEPPERSEAQWTVFANELFMRLDEGAATHAAARGQTRQRRRHWVLRPALAATAAAVVLSVVLFHGAQGPERLAPARIMSVSGQVAVVHDNDRACPADSLLSCDIRPGHTIRARAGATTMIRLDAFTGLTLLGDAELTVLASSHARRRFRLRRGEVIASVSPRTARQSFEIVTENAVCKVVGTVFSVSYDSAANETGLSVFKGAVRMTPSGEHGGGEMLVGAGRFATIAGDRPRAPRALTESQTPIQSISLLHQSLAVARDSAGGNGLLSIDSDPPNATVFLDGRLVGATPLIIQAPAGKRSVVFSLDGRRERIEDVMIEAGTTADIAASLRSPAPDVSPRRQPHARRRATRPPQQAAGPAFDYATHPDYVEALLQMTVGEYRKALALLEALKDNPIISLDQRTHIMHKIAQCYRGLGDFERALQSIEQRRRNAATAIRRAHLLWEQANLKANCLEDYNGAERDLRDYIQNWPDGAWIDQAWQKLGEVLYVQGEVAEALEAYERHVAHAQNTASLDKTFFELARILRTDRGAYSRAARWYNRLIDQFPNSDYIEHALFELADCYRKTGDIARARRVHARYRKRFPEGRWETLSSR
jgi:tetratricopeptide (TPR) repeat protein/ferric-dicitrate binding protein FerR (iron transport regulator)